MAILKIESDRIEILGLVWVKVPFTSLVFFDSGDHYWKFVGFSSKKEN